MNNDWKPIAIERIKQAIEHIKKWDCYFTSTSNCPVCDFMKETHSIIPNFYLEYNLCNNRPLRPTIHCPAYNSCKTFALVGENQQPHTFRFWKIRKLKQLIRSLEK